MVRIESDNRDENLGLDVIYDRESFYVYVSFMYILEKEKR